MKYVEFESDFNLKSIGKGAFYSSGLKKISIPSNIERIEENDFYICHNLFDVNISNCLKLDKIENYAFYRCSVKHFTIIIFAISQLLLTDYYIKIIIKNSSKKNILFKYYIIHQKTVQQSDFLNDLYDLCQANHHPYFHHFHHDHDHHHL